MFIISLYVFDIPSQPNQANQTNPTNPTTNVPPINPPHQQKITNPKYYHWTANGKGQI
jgi:hypothetical protein